MSVVGDLVQGVVESALREILKKTTGTGRRARRRKRTLTASERLRRIEKLIKPAKSRSAAGARCARGRRHGAAPIDRNRSQDLADTAMIGPTGCSPPTIIAFPFEIDETKPSK